MIDVNNVSIEEIESLEPYPGNPNEGDIGAVSESIKRNGWYGTVVVQTSSRRILAGHSRIAAAKALGESTVPVWWADVDDATARRIVVADNRTNRLGRDDGSALLEILKEAAAEPLVGLAGTGWDGDDLDALVKKLDADAPIRITPDKNRGVKHVCPSCGHEWTGKPS